MAEYIEREYLIAKINTVMSQKKYAKGSPSHFVFELFTVVLKGVPTADVVEVKHGEWEAVHYEGGIFDGTNFEKCSVCQFERLFEDVNFKTTYNYCPNCGAKMDLKEGAEK